jgi:3-oxoacyl-[acyl-carrier-protein] synthase-3
MSLFEVDNVHIRGISACVPKTKVKTDELDFFSKKEVETFIQSTGIIQRHITDGNVCASDLCFQAAEEILIELGWQKNEIDVLIFISQSPDYILPATSNLLQSRLGLSQDCFCLDVSLGCSGYIYGLSLVSNLLQNNRFNKALLLVGDTISSYTSKFDKSVYPLFGDAGTATAIEFDNRSSSNWIFDIGSDGSGSDAIKINAGGSRFRTNKNSFDLVDISIYDPFKGKRSSVDLRLEGIDVFNFAIKKAPNSIFNILNFVSKGVDDIDYFFLHQANLFMNETIRKKIKVEKDKMPYSIQNFGNTNGASIPLTIVHSFNNLIQKNDLSVLLCGFGVGLSWGSVLLNLNKSLKTSMSYYHA